MTEQLSVSNPKEVPKRRDALQEKYDQEPKKPEKDLTLESEKQRRYLWKNEPKIAREWTKTYGSKPKGKKKKSKRRKK